jgi:DNA-directed RNA polymerase specialized sigma24 family protein
MSSYIYWGNRAASTFEENTQPRALTPRHEDEVIAAYEAGMSQAEIGEVFGVSNRTVRRILKRRGVKARRRHRTLSDEQEKYDILKRHGIKTREPRPLRALSPKQQEEVIAAYEAGMSQPEISEVFGVYPSTVSRILKRRGVKFRRYRALRDEQERVLVSAYLGGSPGRVVAKAFGISHQTVYDILKRHGIKTREPRPLRALSPREEDEVVAAYEAGMSQTEIGEVLGVSQGTVYKILKRHGIKTREPRRSRALSPKEEDEVISVYEAGMSQAEIGEVLGVSQQTVSRILERRGVKTRNPSGGVSTALALAAVSFLVLGVSMARGARLR